MMNNNILDRLKTPAIGLIVTAALNGIIGLLSLVSGAIRFSGLLGKEKLPAQEAERFGYLLGTISSYAIALLSLIICPIIIFGAIKMMKGKSRGLAMASAILAILPFTSCCFAIGAIFGIWAIIVLVNPEVKAFFANGENQASFYPPQPPNNW